MTAGLGRRKLAPTTLYGLVEKNYNEQFTAWILKEVNNTTGILPVPISSRTACLVSLVKARSAHPSARVYVWVRFRCTSNCHPYRHVTDPAGGRPSHGEDTEQDRSRGRSDTVCRYA